MNPAWPILGLAGLLCLLLSGCGPFLDEMAERRSVYANAGEGPIVVAVVDEGPGAQFVHGAQLAVDAINRSEEGLLGRPLELMVRPGGDRFAAVRSTVNEIAADPRVTAVLGHRHPEVAVPASVVYEQAKVLFMARVMSRQLTWYGFDFVLRMLPDDHTMAEQLASVAALFGYERLALLHSHDDHSRAAAFLFEEAVRSFPPEVVFRGSFFTKEQDYRPLLSGLIGIDFDAVVVVTGSDAGARLLRQLRELNIDTPVLGGHELSLGGLPEEAGEAGDKTVVPTLFTGSSRSAGVERFIRAYSDAYGREPGQAAAEGYDGIQVLAALIERAGTTEPQALATTARFSGGIAGLASVYRFDQRGDLYGRGFRFEVLRQGQWWPLPGVEAPFLLSQFQRASVSASALAEVTDADVGTAASRLRGQHTGAAPPAASVAATPPSHADAAPSRESPPLPGSREDRPAEARSIDLERLRGGGLDRTERDQAWLALVHELLDFERLGVVATPSQGNAAAALALARRVAKERGFAVELCRPRRTRVESGSPRAGTPGARAGDHSSPHSNDGGARRRLADGTDLEKSVLRCYSQLARKVEAVYALNESGLSPSDERRLNLALRQFGVASFALDGTTDADRGLTLQVDSSGVDLNDTHVIPRFSGLLKGLNVRELNERVADIPAIRVDLGAFRQLGLRLQPRALALVSGVLEAGSLDRDILSATKED